MQKLFETVIDHFVNFSFSDLGTWASLIGLGLTGITVYAVFGIKRRFLFNTNFDLHIERINLINAKITTMLQDFSANEQQIELEIALLGVEIRAMEQGANSNLLSDVIKTRKLIGAYKVRFWVFNGKTEKAAREIKKYISIIAAESFHHRKKIMVGD